MPQMAPMLWFFLFFYFILLTLLLMELMFFQVAYEPFNKSEEKKYSSLYWKW
uniref:ATP synthase complex subunit 8 n=1 Tax=Hyalella franciscae TaxID=2759777 RepID=A0A7T8ZST1_9CRUS|nr:ATP synthase F0 subunit 8 [Hyalella franciscae]